MPVVSHTVMFWAPAWINSLVTEMAEAPAPLKTILTSSSFRSVIFKALSRAARPTTAVPCWSS